MEKQMRKEITTRTRKRYLDKLNDDTKKCHYTPRPEPPVPPRRFPVIPLCIVVSLIIGIAIGIMTYPFINSVQFAAADTTAVDLNDVPVDTIRKYVIENKYLFPEFFPDVLNMIKELKPTPAPTVTPAPTPKPSPTPAAVKSTKTTTAVKDKAALKVIDDKGQFKSFRISYLKEYFRKFKDKTKFPETKYHYIRNLESVRTPDGVLLFSFSTPKQASVAAVVYSDGSVRWDSKTSTQLDVEKAIQIMIDNVRL
jgi:hypothetical protein